MISLMDAISSSSPEGSLKCLGQNQSSREDADEGSKAKAKETKASSVSSKQMIKATTTLDKKNKNSSKNTKKALDIGKDADEAQAKSMTKKEKKGKNHNDDENSSFTVLKEIERTSNNHEAHRDSDYSRGNTTLQYMEAICTPAYSDPVPAPAPANSNICKEQVDVEMKSSARDDHENGKQTCLDSGMHRRTMYIICALLTIIIAIPVVVIVAMKKMKQEGDNVNERGFEPSAIEHATQSPTASAFTTLSPSITLEPTLVVTQAQTNPTRPCGEQFNQFQRCMTIQLGSLGELVCTECIAHLLHEADDHDDSCSMYSDELCTRIRNCPCGACAEDYLLYHYCIDDIFVCLDCAPWLPREIVRLPSGTPSTESASSSAPPVEDSCAESQTRYQRCLSWLPLSDSMGCETCVNQILTRGILVAPDESSSPASSSWCTALNAQYCQAMEDLCHPVCGTCSTTITRWIDCEFGESSGCYIDCNANHRPSETTEQGESNDVTNESEDTVVMGTNSTTSPIVLEPCCPEDYTGRRPYKDCNTFIECTDGVRVGKPQSCGVGLRFDPTSQTCRVFFFHVLCSAPAPCLDNGGDDDDGNDNRNETNPTNNHDHLFITPLRPIELVDRVPLTHQSAMEGTIQHYTLAVPPLHEVSCILQGDNGDADMYLRFDQPAMIVSSGGDSLQVRAMNECSSLMSGSVEFCRTGLSTGRRESVLYVTIHAYESYEDVTVQCIIRPYRPPSVMATTDSFERCAPEQLTYRLCTWLELLDDDVEEACLQCFGDALAMHGPYLQQGKFIDCRSFEDGFCSRLRSCQCGSCVSEMIAFVDCLLWDGLCQIRC